MKSWFNSLPAREQLLIAVAVLGILLLILVNGVWRPMAKSIDQLEKANQQASLDLSWMRSAVQQYKQLSKSGRPGAAPEVNLTVQVNKLVNSHQLKMNRFQPGQNNSAQLWLEDASFDQLLLCVSAMEAQGINVDSFTVNATGQSGLVRAKLKVSRG